MLRFPARDIRAAGPSQGANCSPSGGRGQSVAATAASVGAHNPAQAPLIELPDELPHGLVFRHDFLTVPEERALLDLFATLPFREAKFKEYYARRRVVSFHNPGIGESYDDDLAPAGPPPPLLETLRRKIATFVGIALGSTAFLHLLVSGYQTGTPIGWHRDKTPYG